ncbi:helix-turn-helix domain-containing protein [Pseudonocardia tropica]|uniref:Helix-turn-helix domain-containing protein n=1 Tax=Pseudonocardia tropica TaxID=681289 RepID=A0ABV1JXF0_9PSEU
MDQTTLMTTAEVADVLRRPTSTLRYWRHLGEGPRSFRIGRAVVYSREDVERWIAEQRDADPTSRAS